MAEPVFAGRYRLGELLAEGGMAKVYLGTDTRLGRNVAVKVLSAELARDASFVARFEAEAKAAASLDHPSIVKVYDFGADSGSHYIVMPFIEGMTLAELVRRDGPFTPAEAVRIAVQVCGALESAHALGIVHRDIKPGNIMLEDGAVRVMDFGIAKTMTARTQVGDVLGTASYLSPEQARGDPVDRRSDIYSLGCVLYQMVTGEPPLPGDSLLEVASRLATEVPIPPSEHNPLVSPALDSVILQALAKDPVDRFQSAGEMADALQGRSVAAVVPDRTVAEAKPNADRTEVLPGRSQPGRFRVLPLVVGLVLGVAAMLGISAAFRSDPAPEPVAVESPSFSPEPAPSPSPSKLPPPSPVPSVEETGTSAGAIRGEVGALSALFQSAQSSGAMTERAADQIMDEVIKAQEEYDKQDYADAVRRMGRARDELAKYLKREEVAPDMEGAILQHLNSLQRLVSV